MGVKLHLGCGDKRLEGYVNVDIVKKPSVDMTMNLSEKWKFKDGSIDEIYMDNVLEHLDFWHAITEIRRVLKTGGKCTVIVPHFSSPSAYMPQHKTLFSYKFFNLGFREDFVGLSDLKIEKIRLIPPVKKLGFIANMVPGLWDWFFPVSSIYVELRKV